MSDALRYRRTLVVSTAIAVRNLERLVASRESNSLRVWRGRRSNRRFLAGLEELILGSELVLDAEQPSTDDEVAVHELLGSHPTATCAIALETHLFGVRLVDAGEGVSYGGTYVAPSNRIVGLAPVGFADGIDRRLSGRLRVRVDGHDVPVVGRIAMDSISIDITEVPGVRVGSVVSVYGDSSDGAFGIADAAHVLGISTAEIITRLSERAEVVWR